MARAFPHTDQSEYGQPQGEWQALRGELVALLDQVETQVARTGRQDPGYSSLTERMRDLRMQVTEPEPDTRHREALASVKRAVDRFSDRDETGYAPLPPNPRETLQAAIQQIRSTSGTPMRAPAPMPTPAAPRLDEFAEAVTGISTRLERLEGELRVQARSQTGNVKEIADQVAQLSHVVELLAGAVGETGQVKRLEGQIASLAKMVAQGPQVDLSSLNQRLDDVSRTVGRLADLQRAYAERQENSGFVQRLDDVSATVGRLADLQVQYANKVDSAAKANPVAESMRAIEEGVRNVYDRIDSIERHATLSPGDLEKLTDELARFTEAMRNQAQPQGLVELIDALNTRIGDIESRSPEVGGLKTDIEALRNMVISAMEPRFASIEMQIEALGDRIEQRPADTSIGQLEAQVRQLVARMDQTGEQLTGLAKLYNQPSEPAPDFEALAALVAARTSEALVRIDPPAPIAAGFDENDFAEIEKRVARVMKSVAQERPAEDFSGMRDGIREVSDRLARLETSLMDRAKEAARIEAAPLAAFTPPAPPKPAPFVPAPAPVAAAAPALAPMAELPRDPIGDAIAAAEREGTVSRRPDTMPANPADDAPLNAKPFPDGPVRSALEAKNGPRKRHPGLDAAEPVAAYDPATASLPPRPQSSFDAPAPEPFVEPAASPAADIPTASYPSDAVASPSANTFIQAHRRAARQNATTPVAKPEPTAASDSSSLIGRALARFQGAKSKAEPAPEAVEPPRERKGVPKRQLAGDKQPRTEWKPDDEEMSSVLPPADGPRVRKVDAVELPTRDQGDDEPKVSFITKHRRPILLGITVIAVSILALNLVAQRMGGGKPAPATAVETAPADVGAIEAVDGLLDAQPISDVSTLSTTPRVIPMVDSFATGSIDPMSRTVSTAEPMAFSTTAVPPMPQAFGAAETLATGTIAPVTILDPVEGIAPLDLPEPLPAEIASPVQVELPPVGIGPDELRNAAANGDARAQFEIAAIYTEGRAVPEDLAQAAIWYERSAAQGFAPAQYRLGNLYENGRGVDKDLQLARLWYQRAAETGNRMSMHNLAALYAGGEMGKQQFDSAAEWFEQAAARGMTDSQFNLGMLFARGLGVAQDMSASYKWFSLAANRGDKDAAKARDDIARSLGADAVGALNAEIVAWVPQQVDMAANYAPIGTWSDKFDPGETIAKKEVVLNVQMALRQLGYDVGTPDGLAGPKTALAIKAFERATGMTEIGAINPRLLAVLGSQPV